MIIPGSNSEKLAEKVAKKLNKKVAKLEVKKFPDGELYVRILSDVKGKECAVIKTTRNNDDLIELFLILDALKDLGASKLHAIIPHLAYARQDRRFKDGEAVSAKTILKIVDGYADSIATVNCHFIKKKGRFNFYGIRVENLDAVPLVAGYFKKLKNPVVIAPDKGSIDRAKTAAKVLKCRFNYLEKTRISGSKVKTREKNLGVTGKDILIIDDIVSTGGTIINAVKIIKKQKPKSTNVGCVHGVFSKGTSGFRVDELVCTDTIQNKLSRVSVADIIADYLRK